MTKTVDILVTYTTSYVDVNTTNVSVTLKGALPELGIGNNSVRFGSFAIVASGEDNTTTFLTLQAGLNYLYGLHGSDIVSDIDYNYGSHGNYVLGGLVSVDDAIKQYAQPRNAHLETLSGLSGLSTHIKAFLECADENAVEALLSYIKGFDGDYTSLDNIPLSFPPSSHSHSVGDITGFNAAVDSRIENIVGAAPAALDTLQEIAAALGDDEDFAGTMTAALSNKVDKVTGKGLSANDFTDLLKTKLDGIPGDTEARLVALEAWKGIMPKKMKVYTGNTDANGKLVITFAGGEFASAPILVGFDVFNNDDYSLVMNTLAVSTSDATVCFLREKNTSVPALGGNVMPSQAYASQSVTILAIEF